MSTASIRRAQLGIRGGMDVCTMTILKNAGISIDSAKRLTDEQLSKLGMKPDNIQQLRQHGETKAQV